MFKSIKYFIQRGRRGYSDEDIWSFDMYLADMMPGALRQLKKGVGCPSEFYDAEAINNEFHKWHDVLEAMAQGFEAAKFIKNDGYYMWEETKEGRKLGFDTAALNNAKAKADLGLKLFAENYMYLWD